MRHAHILQSLTHPGGLLNPKLGINSETCRESGSIDIERAVTLPWHFI